MNEQCRVWLVYGDSMNPEKVVFEGRHKECCDYIRRQPKRVWENLAIMYVQSGRWASYVL